MAAKRKQEEKHLKQLRDMTTLQHNRKCFDCDQRGPTYVNMTIGSFVCTSCSGILRGLNPPHRVKSISMTTFTQQEIEFLQKHGNEVCKQIWLGLYDDRSSVYPDFRNPQKVKDFLQEKYEKKRWFVPAERAWAVAAAHASISGSSASSASSTPEVKPVKSLYETASALPLSKGTPTQSPAVSRSQGSQQEKKVAPFDLLTDLGGDIFAAPQSAPPYFANFTHFNNHAGGSSASTNANFANFDNFPKSSSADFGAFCSSGNDTTVIKAHAVTQDKYAALANLDNVFSYSTSTQGASSQLTNFSSATVGPSVMTSNQSSPPANMYAALAELDNVFSSPTDTSNVTSRGSVFGTVQSATKAQTHPGVSNTPAAFGAATNPFVAAPILPATAAMNPFQTNGRTAGLLGTLHTRAVPLAHFVSFGTASMSMPTLFATPARYTLPTSFSGGFQQPILSAPMTFTQHSAFPQQPVGGGFGSFGQPKPMVMPYGQPMATSAVSSNPFLAGAPMGQFPTGSSSTNPFL
ncbi:arf-GAP domain and FG repeat-containing protein 1-like isoform X3 [Scyliorhinus torazame]|uniref:arf-GAP domain and FG repeat-containing protein 1-like isoform X3 n=1 Tax=Scyliorhinus torazame TaxID=75743 RepID=UPI003B5B75A8